MISVKQNIGYDYTDSAVRKIDDIDRKQDDIRKDLDEIRSRNDALYRLISTMRELDGFF